MAQRPELKPPLTLAWRAELSGRGSACAAPLVLGDLALFRAPGLLAALDLATGAERWRVELGPDDQCGGWLVDVGGAVALDLRTPRGTELRCIDREGDDWWSDVGAGVAVAGGGTADGRGAWWILLTQDAQPTLYRLAGGSGRRLATALPRGSQALVATRRGLWVGSPGTGAQPPGLHELAEDGAASLVSARPVEGLAAAGERVVAALGPGQEHAQDLQAFEDGFPTWTATGSHLLDADADAVLSARDAGGPRPLPLLLDAVTGAERWRGPPTALRLRQLLLAGDLALTRDATALALLSRADGHELQRLDLPADQLVHVGPGSLGPGWLLVAAGRSLSAWRGQG